MVVKEVFYEGLVDDAMFLTNTGDHNSPQLPIVISTV